jgi:hypothetical protein
VFLKPSDNLVDIEPVYLQGVVAWVKAGGHVVVAPPSPDSASNYARSRRLGQVNATTILRELGLTDVVTNSLDPSSPATGPASGAGKKANSATSPTTTSGDDDEEDDPDASNESHLSRLRKSWWTEGSQRQVDRVAVKCEGDLAALAAAVKNLAVPLESVTVVDVGADQPAGQITYVDSEGNNQTLLANYSVGKGIITVVGEPALFENQFLSKEDNSVLAVRLLEDRGGPAIFDEFYHGLVVRGNPLWLLTNPRYALVAVMTCLLLAAWLWRRAIFLGPPLITPPISRRSIAEYLNAMGRLFVRGAESRVFLLNQAREGALWSLRIDLRLPHGRETVESIEAALGRRDPATAQRFAGAIKAVDQAIAQGPNLREPETLDALRKLAECL